MSNSSFPPAIHFDFPMTQPGIAFGNGTLKLWAWGDETLCLTIARGGFDDETENWDERAATQWSVDELLKQLERRREQKFLANSAILELDFGSGSRPLAGTLGADGVLQIALNDGRAVSIECAMDEEIAWIDGIAGSTWQLRSDWQHNRDAGDKRDVRAPLEIQIADGYGFVWELDAQDSRVTMVRERESALFITTAQGETEDAARAAVSRARHKPDINPIYYWKQFWRSAPRVTWPNAVLQRKWDIALFRQAQANATTDAAIDFLAAFSRLLVQCRRDGIYVLPSIPRRWREFSFDGIRAEGAFLVGASVEGGKVVEVRVRSEKGGNLRLFAGANAFVERAMVAGENWVWRA